jgi:hypothetical protein
MEWSSVSVREAGQLRPSVSQRRACSRLHLAQLEKRFSANEKDSTLPEAHGRRRLIQLIFGESYLFGRPVG